MKILIKLGGSLLESGESRTRLAQEIADAAHHHQIAVVAWRRQADDKLSHRARHRKPVRRRPACDHAGSARRGAESVRGERANAQLVSTFLGAAGANPVGLSGLDAGVLDAEPLDPALGHVGKPVRSDPRLIELLIGAAYLPVIACVGGDSRGATYNVNGDQAASAIGAAFGAHKLIFLTDVDGVRGANGGIAETLDGGRGAGSDQQRNRGRRNAGEAGCRGNSSVRGRGRGGHRTRIARRNCRDRDGERTRRPCDRYARSERMSEVNDQNS